MRYGLYVFLDDESATIWDEPFSHSYNPEQTDLTLKQRVDLVSKAQNPRAFTREQIAAWPEEAQYQFLWDRCTLQFNSVAVIPPEHEEMLRSVADACYESFGTDSSTYRAVEIFNRVLKGLAVKVFRIPIGDSDREDEFEYN